MSPLAFVGFVLVVATRRHDMGHSRPSVSAVSCACVPRRWPAWCPSVLGGVSRGSPPRGSWGRFDVLADGRKHPSYVVEFYFIYLLFLRRRNELNENIQLRDYCNSFVLMNCSWCMSCCCVIICTWMWSLPWINILNSWIMYGGKCL